VFGGSPFVVRLLANCILVVWSNNCKCYFVFEGTIGSASCDAAMPNVPLLLAS